MTTRVAAIDLGKARVGLAVADELGLYAHARPALDGHDKKALLQSIAEVARDEGIGRFLLGVPFELGGAEGPAARRAIAFARQLADATGVEVELVDERLSTVEAAHQLRASGVAGRDARSKIDGVAAAVLLQAWLDARRPPAEGEG